MKTKKTITTIALALTLGIIYTGCKKDKNEVVAPASTTTATTTTTTATSTESQNSICENSFSEIFTSITQIAEGNSNLRSSCPTITVDTTPILSFPKTVTIDYGTGCNGKKGKLTAVFTGKFGAFGTIITITADSNYSQGSNKINVGTHTIVTGLSNSGHKTFNLSIGGGHVMMGGGNVTWNSTRTVQWIEGDSTLDPMDDVYLISGSTTGTNLNGDAFSSTITTPLRVATNCAWIESGIITVTTINNKTRTIDFGTGTCDNKATVTVDTTTYNITM